MEDKGVSIPERYVRNRQAMTEAQQKRLAEASVLVLGCGGLGGCVIEHLARMGVGHIAAV
ncbi:MAG: ThiF family adenylyltransferase, partial [Oscillospiraceae bacterium]|nr:ThiF family adenylyltransferase [Oscillospiraceae bacterium]